MKNIIKTLFIAVLLSFGISVLAQAPPLPPGNPSGGGGGGGPVGAPIDGGLGILVAMGVAYGGRKYYQARKSKKKGGEEGQAFKNPSEI
ncbi:MAG: signal peptidase [Bacteroidota bacterium]